MGNCQAAEAATVVIKHPGGKVERMYWSVSANEIMSSNPGHYISVIITSTSAKSENGTPLRQLKLLRPDDTLHIGHVYHLISFEEVLKQFSGKKDTKLSRLLSRQKQSESDEKTGGGSGSLPEILPKVDHDTYRVANMRGIARPGQWKPALQSIDEMGR